MLQCFLHHIPSTSFKQSPIRLTLLQPNFNNWELIHAGKVPKNLLIFPSQTISVNFMVKSLVADATEASLQLEIHSRRLEHGESTPL